MSPFPRSVSSSPATSEASMSNKIGTFADSCYQLGVVFPYNALTVPRFADRLVSGSLATDNTEDPTAAASPTSPLEVADSASTSKPQNKRRGRKARQCSLPSVLDMPQTIDDGLIELCTSDESVSSLVAKDPTLAPGDAWARLYGNSLQKKHHNRGELAAAQGAKPTPGGKGGPVTSSDDLELTRAAKCGRWGPTKPSELFLRIYHDALCALGEDLHSGVVSPSLMGSCGTVPLTILSTIPDICRHMSNLIVRAEHDIFLSTNYWANGVATRFIVDAFHELNRRCASQSPARRVVVKILYDRGSAKQLSEPHYVVPESEFTSQKVALPRRDEVPNLDLEVMNFHTPLLGTMHSKGMVVDRRIALLQSNNIQDNDNVEMAVHLEGPIVDSVYDAMLITWHRCMDPPLPSRDSPAADAVVNGEVGGSFGIGSHAALFGKDSRLQGSEVATDPGQGTPSRVAFGSHAGDMAGELPPILVGPSQTSTPDDNDERAPSHQADAASNDYANQSTQPPHHGAADTVAEDFLDRGTQPLSPSPQANNGDDGGSSGNVISSPPASLPEHNASDPHYDADIAGEVRRVQASVSGRTEAGGAVETRMEAVTRHLNHTTNSGLAGDAPECSTAEAMTPYVPLPRHALAPMALVNRAPYGPPNHKFVTNPQNAAWLAALRHARRSVFIQTPTLNAELLVPAIAEAVGRGVDVYCYVCLGYNDAGELLPLQGGHNELIAHRLFTSLAPAARAHLHYFWYVGKDQTRPLTQHLKRRSCHVKLMIVDEAVGIQGSGNQDTQSWYHSQEVNVMIDSPFVCRAWIDALRRNQNTHIYGALSQRDGVWTDAEGKQAESAMGPEAPRFGWAKGLLGAVKRVQGTGGF